MKLNPRTLLQLAAVIAVSAAVGYAWHQGRTADGRACGSAGTAAEQHRCWETSLRRTMGRHGINAAFEELGRLYGGEPAFAAECHSYAHLIGQTAYEEFARKHSFAATPKATYCGYGFYHGFMEAMLASTGNLTQARELCTYMDTALAGKATNATLACFHGIGHGVVDGSNRAAWGDAQEIIDPGLALCDEIATSEDEYYRCYSGVFNSLAIAYSSTLYGLSLDDRDPLAICRQQRASRQDPCYANMMTSLMVITENDLAAAARYVAEIPGDRLAAAAMETLSSLAVRQRLTAPDYDDIVSICQNLEPRLRAPCIGGFGSGLMEFGGPESEYRNALRFCQSRNITMEERTACFGGVLGYARSAYPREKVRAICGSVADEYRELCPVAP